jgi:hypothetical protein
MDRDTNIARSALALLTGAGVMWVLIKLGPGLVIVLGLALVLAILALIVFTYKPTPYERQQAERRAEAERRAIVDRGTRAEELGRAFGALVSRCAPRRGS